MMKAEMVHDVGGDGVEAADGGCRRRLQVEGFKLLSLFALARREKERRRRVRARAREEYFSFR